jgi:D-alanyl-D-alanine carboxypeptidase/D-alanyl-D-alanine-endopeptidase (penicillin-binding protein 4)
LKNAGCQKIRYYGFLFVIIFVLSITIPSVSGNTEQDTVDLAGGERMGKQINTYINNKPDLEGALAGISVRDGGSGEVLYEHLGDIRLKPASNLKILTAASALSALGKNYTFTTKLRTKGTIENGILTGDLFLKGKGDPTLLPSDFFRFAKALRNKGIRVIDGNIIADDTWYDNVRLSKDLVWSDESFHYGAQVSALTASPDTDYDAGTVMIEVTPGKKAGDKPAYALSPETDYIKVVNKAETAAADAEQELTVERNHGENTIVIKGKLPAASEPVKEWIAVWEPAGYALDLFQQALEVNGITWSGEMKTGKTPQSAETLYKHQSMPLADLLVPFMKLSNNGHGEILVKEMGKVIGNEGSWDKGLEIMDDELNQLHVQTDKLIIRDGSGISHVNHVTANEISGLLHVIQDEDWFPAFYRSLPVSGDQDRMTGGTLQHRLSGMNVRAKTGTIDSVSTLSGYMETKEGKSIIFSILLNNLLDEELGPEIEDNIVKILYEHF